MSLGIDIQLSLKTRKITNTYRRIKNINKAQQKNYPHSYNMLYILQSQNYFFQVKGFISTYINNNNPPDPVQFALFIFTCILLYVSTKHYVALIRKK